MISRTFLAAGAAGLAALIWAGAPIAAQDRLVSSHAAPDVRVSTSIETYCATCHNGSARSASGALLDRFDGALTSANPAAWAKAYRQLQAGAMPPAGAPRPDRSTADAMLRAIEHDLDRHMQPRAAATGAAVAARLATMLWNSGPDEVLKQEAQAGRLNDAAALEHQVRRMLADDRANAFVERFIMPWLQLDTLDKSDPDRKYFPDYDVSLRDSLKRETELFVLSQLREDNDPLELWSGGYTFLNEQLARHYGVANVSGPQFRRVPVGPERAGLLGHGSILMVTSRHQHGVDAAYTTPATRAKWLRLHFFGAPLPNGFPGAQPVKPELPITPQTRTLPAQPCVHCHQNFFALGYALEHFDPLGRWRSHDQAGPVDASGAFVDGTPINGVSDLRRVLLQYPEAFRTTITETLLVYTATGTASPSSGTPDTLARARQILRNAKSPRWSALIAAAAM